MVHTDGLCTCSLCIGGQFYVFSLNTLNLCFSWPLLSQRDKCEQTCHLELLRIHILLPGYPLTNTRRVPGYPFNGCHIFSAVKQDQDCQNRPSRSQDMSKFLHESWSVTSFRTTLWLFSRLLTHFHTY